MKNIILASSSPRRQELLRQIGLEFEIIVPDCDEFIDDSIPIEKAIQKTAYEKAKCVVDKFPVRDNSIIISADTIVVGEHVLGKPGSCDKAIEMLEKLSGRLHYVITGICIYDSESNQYITDYEKTTVKMTAMTKEQIISYVNTGEPIDKAGAYGIQGKGGLYIEKIDGCYYNVVGLPLNRLRIMLDKLNFYI